MHFRKFHVLKKGSQKRRSRFFGALEQRGSESYINCYLATPNSVTKLMMPTLQGRRPLNHYLSFKKNIFKHEKSRVHGHVTESCTKMCPRRRTKSQFSQKSLQYSQNIPKHLFSQNITQNIWDMFVIFLIKLTLRVLD